MLLLLFFITSCSLAPLSSTTSGRSYGAGKFQAEMGNISSTYNLKFGLGITEDFDAGFLMEFGAISTSALFLKYSFINNKIGPSVASEFGYGSTETTKFYYAGVIASVAFSEEFELFINGKINSVSTDEADIEKDEFNGNVKILAYDVTYMQASYGFNLWFSENAGLSIYSTYYKGNDIETISDNTAGASLLFNF